MMMNMNKKLLKIMTIIRNRILNAKEKEKAEKLINKDNEEGKN